MEGLLSKYEFLSEVMAEKNRLDIMQILTNQAKISYVDPQRQYVVVQAQYLSQLKSVVESSLLNVSSFSDKVQQSLIVTNILKRELQFKNEKMAQMQANQQRLLKNIQELKERVQELQQQNKQRLKQNIQLLEQMQENQVIQMNPVARMYAQAQMQTQYCIPIIQFTRESLGREEKKEKEVNKENNNEEQLRKLKNQFNEMVKEISQEFQNKIQELKEGVLDISNWEDRNRVLVSENEQMRMRIEQIDDKKEKIREWKQKLNVFMHRVEDNVDQESVMEQEQGMQGEQEDDMNEKEKIKMLQNALFRREMDKKIAYQHLKLILSSSQTQVQEDNIITTLLETSNKVKQVVKYLLSSI